MTIKICTNRNIIAGWLGNKMTIFHNGHYHKLPKKDDVLEIEGNSDKPLIVRMGRIYEKVSLDESVNGYMVEISPLLAVFNVVFFAVLIVFMIGINYVDLNTYSLISLCFIYIAFLFGYYKWVNNGNHLNIVPIKNP